MLEYAKNTVNINQSKCSVLISWHMKVPNDKYTGGEKKISIHRNERKIPCFSSNQNTILLHKTNVIQSPLATLKEIDTKQIKKLNAWFIEICIKLFKCKQKDFFFAKRQVNEPLKFIIFPIIHSFDHKQIILMFSVHNYMSFWN